MENHIIGWLTDGKFYAGEKPFSKLPVEPVYDPGFVRGLQLAYNELEVTNKQLTEINGSNQDKIENGIKALQGYKVDGYQEITRLHDQLSEGRHYLMGVDEDKITVEDALESFGFGRNGLQ